MGALDNMSQKVIMLVNPEMTYQDAPLPYLYLVLKSYYHEFGRHKDKWRWAMPIINVENVSFEELVDQILVEKPDVLAFSCYIWNYNLNLKLGEAIKSKLPNTLIAYGGPQVLYDSSPNWIKEHWWVDLICDGNGGRGEEFFRDLLDQMVENPKVDFQQVSYCLSVNSDRSAIIKSNVYPKKTELVWPRSMFYGSETEVQVLKHMAMSRGQRLSTLWETARGCPYSCSYCDWGGSTGTKVIKKSDETIAEELRMMEELDVKYIDVCDANFGIFKKRDVQIIEKLIERVKNGWNVEIGLNGKAKNDIETVQKIDFMLLDSKIAVKSDYHYSINAADSKVAEAVSRWTYPTEKHVDFVKKVKEFGYKTRIEYILGLPETTLDTFYAEFNDISKADAWLSERYVWSLLHRAPAARPSYIEKYKIKTVPVRYMHYNTLRQTLRDEYYVLDDERYQGQFELVVETSTYTREQWFEMYFMDNFARGVECSRITTDLRRKLESTGMSSAEFFKNCWQAVLNMRGPAKDSVQFIFNSIEEALGGKSTFAYYKYSKNHNSYLGLQTIVVLLLSEYVEEFIYQLRNLLEPDEVIQDEIKEMQEKLKKLWSASNPEEEALRLHHLYVYENVA